MTALLSTTTVPVLVALIAAVALHTSILLKWWLDRLPPPGRKRKNKKRSI